MSRNEAETRAQIIDPALHKRGWSEDLIRREETAGAVDVVAGRATRRARGRADYVLRVRAQGGSQPVAVALIEAKAERLPPLHGLEQAKLYAACKRLHVPFVFSSNGHLFVEFDRRSGLTSAPRPMAQFPTPAELRARYEADVGFSLDADEAKPLLVPYAGGEATRRYYQDAAVRAVLEKLARPHGPKRALLSLATGSGKTFIAVHLLKRTADAGRLRRTLFLCDRDELRRQCLGALQRVFGSDAAAVYEDADGANHARNARVHVATYQTLDVATPDAAGSFLQRHYPENHFSHIVIDECHRSAWGKWSEVLRRNPDAVQIGLTATPRQIELGQPEAHADDPDALEDERILADNLRHFGEPVYEYDLGQGIEDGYLAACEIVRRDIFLDDNPRSERETGVERADLADKLLADAHTGEVLMAREARERYEARDLEAHLLLPERVAAMCHDLFQHLLATGGPEQKTIVFCARDDHADRVSAELNNLYAGWCRAQGRARLDPFAFKCTAASGGQDFVPDLRGALRHHFVATTVDLLTTGVDVPCVRNVVFFKYVHSPIAFHQMAGRGTRIDPPSGKLMFRVYDYTNATRLFGGSFVTRFRPRSEPSAEPADGDSGTARGRVIVVEGFDVAVSDAGRSIVTQVDGVTQLVTLEEYKAHLAARLVGEAPTLETFRAHWIAPQARRELLARLPEAGRSALVVRALDEMAAYDLYDVLAELGYGLAPRTREGRAAAFQYKHEGWLAALPSATSATLRALASQFARAGTEALESAHVFDTPAVRRAGGLDALRALGAPAEVIREAKARLFAA